jgi:multiple sugar transport system ATP-binding protein
MKIRLEELSKIFGNKEGVETVAVDKLSLDVPSGKLIGLLGPSGCGKSTTLFMIAGLHEPTGGKILFGEEDVTDIPPEQRGIGLVFQNYALYPHMTVRQNIAFPLNNSKEFKEKYKGDRKGFKAEVERIVQETATVVDIEELLDRKPAQLSGGQQQRVAIARALAKNPKVLLLDEPLSNLDARLRLQTREEIKRIQRKTGVTTIFVTHDQEEAMSISDQIVVMKDGVLQQVAAPQDMYDNPGNAFVATFLGNPPINMFDAEVVNGHIVLNGKEMMEVELENQAVRLAVRPESFKIDPKGLKASITKVEHIGRDKLIGINLNDQNVNALVDSEYNAKVGEPIHVSFKEKGVHVFTPEGKRID